MKENWSVVFGCANVTRLCFLPLCAVLSHKSVLTCQACLLLSGFSAEEWFC